MVHRRGRAWKQTPGVEDRPHDLNHSTASSAGENAQRQYAASSYSRGCSNSEAPAVMVLMSSVDGTAILRRHSQKDQQNRHNRTRTTSKVSGEETCSITTCKQILHTTHRRVSHDVDEGLRRISCARVRSGTHNVCTAVATQIFA